MIYQLACFDGGLICIPVALILGALGLGGLGTWVRRKCCGSTCTHDHEKEVAGAEVPSPLPDRP